MQPGLTPIQKGVVDALATLMVLTAMLIAELRRLDSSVKTYAVQAAILVSILIALGFSYPWFFWWALTATITKVYLAPWIMLWALRRSGRASEVEKPLIPSPLSVVAMVTMYAASIALAIHIASLSPSAARLGLPPLATSIALILIGLFIITTRRNAMKQILGVVMFENGSHLLLACTAFYVPETVEIGMATDAVAMVAIMSALAYIMARVRGDMDVSKLTLLKH